MNTAFIVNSRRCPPALKRDLQRSFRGNSHDILFTSAPGHAEELARRAIQSGAGRIIAVGGDGTVHEVVNGIAHSQAVLGVLPAGTGNDFASTLALPREFESAVRLFNQGHTRDIDLLTVNRRYYVSTAGIGLPARVIARQAGWRRDLIPSLLGKMGAFSYDLALACEVLRRGFGKHHVRIVEDGVGREESIFAYLAGHVPSLGRRFRALPDARPDHGGLFTCVFMAGAGHVSDARAVLSCRSTRRAPHPLVRTWQGRMAVVESDRPVAAFADGEILEPGRRFVFAVHASALRVLACPTSRSPRRGVDATNKKTARLGAGGLVRTSAAG